MILIVRPIVCAVVTLAATSSCSYRDVEGSTSTYGFAAWTWLLLIIGGLVAMPLGFLFRKRWSRGGWVTMIVGGVALVFLGPTMAGERVVIDDQHLEVKTGLWFARKNHSVQFDQVDTITYVTYEERGRRGRKNTKHKLEFTGKRGNLVATVPVGDLLEDALDEVFDRAEAKGIKFAERDDRT